MRKEKVTFRIGGMFCPNCAMRIAKRLRSESGVIRTEVSYEKMTAEVEYDAEWITTEGIKAVIESLDYSAEMDPAEAYPEETYPEETDPAGNHRTFIYRNKRTAGDPGNRPERRPVSWLRIAGAAAAVAVGYVFLQYTGLLNLLVPGQLAESGMGYGMLFLTGLLTSVHCIAMCSGINLTQSLPQRGEETPVEGGRRIASGSPDADPTHRMRGRRVSVSGSALAYNLGRVCSYAATGVFLGSIGFLLGGGADVGIPVMIQGGMKMLAGAVMVIMGINMLGLVPGLRHVRIPVPAFLTSLAERGRLRTRRPFLIGVLNGFMPCGPLQMMWVIALASGSPLRGGLSMLAFSLGTVPLMLGLGAAVSALGRRFTRPVLTAGSVLVIILGLSLFSQGGILAGWMQPMFPGDSPMTASTTGEKVEGERDSETAGEDAAGEKGSSEEIQVIRSTLETRSYPNITVQAGIPVKWIIDAPEQSITSCNVRMMIPDYEINYAFSPGENVIEFTPEETGEFSYSCWMGMIYGTITVTG